MIHVGPGGPERHGQLGRLTRVPSKDLDLDRVARYYDDALGVAEKTVKDCGLKTHEGRFAATHAIATARLLRPLISDPLLFSTPLYQNTGGPPENPHRVIDVIGQDLFFKLQTRLPLPSGMVYVEENHQWQEFTNGHQTDPSQISVNIDTLDGTSSILNGQRDQASAIMITDLQRNRFLGGSIVSLVDDALITIEPGSRQLFQLREEYKRAYPMTMAGVKHEKMRLATLARHLSSLLPNFFKNSAPDLNTFGGYGLYKVATGVITTMFDPRGQSWYEAVMWGLMGEKLGLAVTDLENHRYDWYQILRDSQVPGYSGRMPIAISHNEALHYEFLDLYEKSQANRTENSSLVNQGAPETT